MPAPPLPPMAREADALWKLLDKLSTTDPAAYARFVSSAKSEHEARPSLTLQAGFCVWAALAAVGESPTVVGAPTSAGGPPPPPRGVVAGHRVWVNLCSSDRIAAPTLASAAGGLAPAIEASRGTPLSLHELLSLDVPLAVSPVRPMPTDEGSSGSNTIAAQWAVDVACAPWVFSVMKREPGFKPSYIAFVLSTLAEEFKWSFSSSSPSGGGGNATWVEAPTAGVGAALYRGGMGEGGKTPLPFYTSPDVGGAQSVSELLASASKALGLTGGGLGGAGLTLPGSGSQGGGGGGGGGPDLSTLLTALKGGGGSGDGIIAAAATDRGQLDTTHAPRVPPHTGEEGQLPGHDCRGAHEGVAPACRGAQGGQLLDKAAHQTETTPRGVGEERGVDTDALSSLLSIGQRLGAEEKKVSGSAAAAAGGGALTGVGAEVGAMTDSASSFAQFVARAMPAEALIWEGACPHTEVVREHDTRDGGDVVRVIMTLDPTRVAIAHPHFLSSAELLIEAHVLRLSLPPDLLHGYEGLSLASIPIALAHMPEGCSCDPDTARAKLNKRAGTLTVTAALQR